MVEKWKSKKLPGPLDFLRTYILRPVPAGSSFDPDDPESFRERKV